MKTKTTTKPDSIARTLLLIHHLQSAKNELIKACVILLELPLDMSSTLSEMKTTIGDLDISIEIIRAAHKEINEDNKGGKDGE